MAGEELRVFFENATRRLIVCGRRRGLAECADCVERLGFLGRYFPFFFISFSLFSFSGLAAEWFISTRAAFFLVWKY